MKFPAKSYAPGFVPYFYSENSLQVQHRKCLQSYMGMLKIMFMQAVCRFLLHSKAPEKNKVWDCDLTLLIFSLMVLKAGSGVKCRNKKVWGGGKEEPLIVMEQISQKCPCMIYKECI